MLGLKLNHVSKRGYWSLTPWLNHISPKPLVHSNCFTSKGQLRKGVFVIRDTADWHTWLTHKGLLPDTIFNQYDLILQCRIICTGYRSSKPYSKSFDSTFHVWYTLTKIQMYTFYVRWCMKAPQFTTIAQDRGDKFIKQIQNGRQWQPFKTHKDSM